MNYEEFKEYLAKEKNASNSTLNAYMGDLRDFEAFAQDQRSKSLAELNGADIAAYVMHLKESGKSPSTVNRKLSTVRCLCDYLQRQGVLKENPALGVKSPKMAKKPLDFLSIEQVSALLDVKGDSPKDLRDKALLEVMYATGMRASEIADAKVKDVDLMIGFIVCNTESRSRMIPIGKPALAALKNYLEKGRPALTAEKPEENALFVNYQGESLSRQGIWKIIKYYGEKAGIESELSPQTLRNSFAVHMLQNGADLKSLQELMGLEDINAAKLYLSVTRNRIMDVYDRTHPRA